MIHISSFLKQLQKWAENNDNIVGIFLVGSHARGQARDDSDIDLIIITKDPQIFIDDAKWINNFGEIKETKKEDWGLLTSLRTFFKNGQEIEFGITTKEWIKTNPVDEGTKKVLSDGFKIIFDRTKLLAEKSSIIVTS